MKFKIKKSDHFADLFQFDSQVLRGLLDLQFRSIVEAESALLQNITLKDIRILDHGSGSQDFKIRYGSKNYRSIDPFYPATYKSEQEIPAQENFDLIVSSEVFEHIEEPLIVLKKLASHQTRGQKIYLTTPFLARQHGAPHDYQRWTQAGLETLLKSAGYRCDKIIRRGNFLSVISALLNHQLFKLFFSRYFLVAITIAPIVFLTLILAHVFFKVGTGGDYYLGLSALATKEEL